MFKHMILAASLALVACGPAAVESAGSTAPPPTSIDHPIGQAVETGSVALDTAWDALDVANVAADAILLAKPAFAGTPAAKALADGLEQSAHWLTEASKLRDKAEQAAAYLAALKKASAALSKAKSAMAGLVSY